jgi:predicted DNA-binding protein
MTLAIELSPEVEKRLEVAAERQGQSVTDYARHVLEEAVWEAEDPYRGIRRGTPEELQQLFDSQGVKPITDINQLKGDFWPEDESVDDFMAARKEWDKEGGPGFPFDDPDECPRDLR